MIDVPALQKTYGGRTVLDVPPLSLVPGERYALLGQNGSGKSTLLKLLSGTLTPDSGAAPTYGIARREIGYLPQSPYAFDLTVLQNVMLPLSGAADARARAEAAIAQLGLTPLLHARGSRLSGGEAQRMALARLLVRPWKLLLLDEPTSSADVLATDLAVRALLAYHTETRCTLLFSSHAPSLARRLGTQAIVLDEGRVAEAGPAADVLSAPRSPAGRALLAYWSAQP